MSHEYKVEHDGAISIHCKINEDIIEYASIAYLSNALYIYSSPFEYIMDAEIHYFDICDSIINHSCFERLLTLLDYQTFCELKRI